MSYQDFARAAAGVLAGALLAVGAIAQTQQPEPATLVVTAPAQWPQVMPCTWKVWFMGESFRGRGRSTKLEPCHHGKVKNRQGSALAGRRLIHVKA